MIKVIKDVLWSMLIVAIFVAATAVGYQEGKRVKSIDSPPPRITQATYDMNAVVINLNEITTQYAGYLAKHDLRIQNLEQIKNEPTLADVVNNVIGSVVHIRCPRWQGSGFVITPRLIMTAQHVVEKMNDFVITTQDNHVIRASRAISCKNADVGFIYIDDLQCVLEKDRQLACNEDGNDLKLKPLKLGDSSSCRLGQEMFAIGSPMGKIHQNAVTKGILSKMCLDWNKYMSMYSEPRWEVLFMTDAATWGGSSGCPVFTMDGVVRGVLVGGFGPEENTSYCVPIDSIRQDIDLILRMFNENKYEVEQPTTPPEIDIYRCH